MCNFWFKIDRLIIVSIKVNKMNEPMKINGPMMNGPMPDDIHKLEEFFSKYGTVKNLEQSTGYAKVLFENSSEASNAFKELKDTKSTFFIKNVKYIITVLDYNDLVIYFNMEAVCMSFKSIMNQLGNL